MVAPICATLLLGVSVACALVSEFFLNTIQGILTIHLVLVNFFVSNEDISVPLQTPNAQLFATATLLPLAFSYYFVNRKDFKLSFTQSVSLAISLFSVDMLILLFSADIAQELNIILFILLSSVGIAGYLMDRPTAHSLNTTGRIELHSADLFVDNTDVFGVLGRGGKYHFLSVLLLLLAQIPVLRKFNLIWYSAYVTRSICTLGMMFTPAFFGGFVQAMKTCGSKVASRKGKSSQHGKPLIAKET